jgi:murein DD-endopeptidase MepM/ murein hydrolase activator NlpD
MKKLVGLVVTPLLCLGAAFFSFLVAGTAIVADSMPGWAQDEAWGWIQGTPQAVGHNDESDLPPGYIGQIIESGSYYWEPMFYSGPESFICQIPVENGYLTSGYGESRPDGYAHTGVDYGSHYRPEDIYAPMGGMVTDAGWSYYLGWTVVIENQGAQVILGHMCCGEKGVSSSPTGGSTIQVEPGDVIDAGMVMGQTGETGKSTGIHLHLEVRLCDDDGRCQIHDPSNVILPGQNSSCPWQHLE